VRRSCLATALTLALLTVVPGRADAQVINTLRGWDDDEPGWSGEVAASIALSEGNSEYFEYNLAGAGQYAKSRHRVRALVEAARRTASGVEVAEATVLHLRHNYELTSVVHSLVFFQTQSNPFQRLQSRVLLGLGARFDVLSGDTWDVSIGAAYMRDREDLTDDDSGPVGENRADFFLSALGKLSEQVVVDAYGFYLPLISDFADARISLGGNLDVILVGQLTLFTGFRFAHNSNPPAGVEKDDIWLSTGLRFRF